LPPDADSAVSKSVLLDNITVEEGAVLEDCIVGKGTSIEKFARVRPGSAIGAHSRITSFSRV